VRRIDVGLMGLAESGKDTAALALVANGWRRVAFADKLKSLAFQFGWNGCKDQKGRKLLQDLGMAARSYKHDFWIMQAFRTALETLHPNVYTDVRFQNEADYIRGRGGIIIRIKKPEQISSDSHESELNQYDIVADYDVVNEGTIEDLHKKILDILT